MRILARLAALLSLWCGVAIAQTPTVGIATGPAHSDLQEIGRDLATLVAPHAALAVKVAETAGTIDNVRRLRVDRTMSLALVHADAFAAFSEAGMSPREIADLLRPLRVVLPLWSEEIHFIARSDAPFDGIAGMRDARINVGPAGSGNAYTIANIYRLLFERRLPAAQASYLTHEEALRRLVTDRSIDVVAVVGSQPLRVLSQMKPEAKTYIKVLAAPDAPALPTYLRARLARVSYPNILDRDVPALAVPLLLVTRDQDAAPDALVRLVSALCAHFAELRHEGHPRWRSLGPRNPVPPDWAVFVPTADALRSCRASSTAMLRAGSP